MTATGSAIMEVDPGSVAGTAGDRFLDEPLARGLNGETAVERLLDEPAFLLNESMKIRKREIDKESSTVTG